MPVVWSERRLLSPSMIAAMAPDHGTWRAAGVLAREGKATAHGRLHDGDDLLLWAEFPEGPRAPAYASVLLPAFTVACTCPSARVPCRHALAALLLDETTPPAGETPAWAAARLAKGRGAADVTAPPPGPDRCAAAAAGLDELARRLRDQLNGGLAALATAGARPWLHAADRLDDAYAPAAAAELRALAALPGAAADWPEQLLPRLGRLMLLAEAFGRLDALAPGERGDALAAAGLPPPPGDDVVADTWRVLGRLQTTHGAQRQQRLWLRGRASRRWALLASAGAARPAEGFCPPVGALLRGALAYAPSAWPLAARPVDGPRLVLPDDEADDTSHESGDIATATAAFAAARAANPWLRLAPLHLPEVFAEPAPAGWRLRDRGGRLLPLPARFAYGWHLLALAGDRPLALFGEWDGATLAPLSVHDGRGWRDLAVWKGVP